MLEFASLYVPMVLVTDRKLHVNSQTFSGLQWKKKNLISLTQVLAGHESFYHFHYVHSHVNDWFIDKIFFTSVI